VVVFIHETIEYDRSQPFNVRDTSDAGVGYRLIKTDVTTLIGRLVAAVFRTSNGGPENGEYIPGRFSAATGLPGQQAAGSSSERSEYARTWAIFRRYRIRTQAAWELLLDQQRNLGLRMGVLERYNSLPVGALPNDLDTQ